MKYFILNICAFLDGFMSGIREGHKAGFKEAVLDKPRFWFIMYVVLLVLFGFHVWADNHIRHC